MRRRIAGGISFFFHFSYFLLQIVSYRRKTPAPSMNEPPSLFMLLLFLLAGLTACSVRPAGQYDVQQAPTPPNYTLPEAWAALPFTEDNADRTLEQLTDRQDTAPVDVFYLHPTTYTGKQGDDRWNGPVYDPALQERTDESAMLYQASIFNGAGRVFAPRYRQAHLHAYYTESREASATRAFELAYSDVRSAFEYYMEHYNEGRPLIIASHSQGTTHAKRLLRDYFDGKPLQTQLVVAYLAGIPVESNYFRFIKVCGGPEEIGCFCSWRTWREGRTPKDYDPDNEIAVTNPLTWTTTDAYAPRALNDGAVLRKFDRIRPEVTDARVHEGLLWISRPRFPWSFLWLSPNYHVGDLNLFYLDIRINAMRRAAVFLRQPE